MGTDGRRNYTKSEGCSLLHSLETGIQTPVSKRKLLTYDTIENEVAVKNKQVSLHVPAWEEAQGAALIFQKQADISMCDLFPLKETTLYGQAGLRKGLGGYTSGTSECLGDPGRGFISTSCTSELFEYLPASLYYFSIMCALCIYEV